MAQAFEMTSKGEVRTVDAEIRDDAESATDQIKLLLAKTELIGSLVQPLSPQ
ncbi:hypothetical protein SAMN03159495_3431 [Pseudomonas sp. NFR16]|nr:hypothetical protein SAMN03159495_3431 [Pseudomonas sp. NFR16]